MKEVLFLFVALLHAFVSCSKQDFDALDAAQIEGRWQVESIRYEVKATHSTRSSVDIPEVSFILS